MFVLGHASYVLYIWRKLPLYDEPTVRFFGVFNNCQLWTSNLLSAICNITNFFNRNSHFAFALNLTSIHMTKIFTHHMYRSATVIHL